MIGVLLLASALAAEPCPGLAVGDGVVTTAEPWPATTPQGPSALCVDEVGRRLAAMPALRTVTVTAKVPDAARADGSAAAVTRAYVERLVATGLSEARVSSVVAAGEEPGKIVVTYTERAAADVGLVTSATGDVRVGPSLASLAAVTPGAQLVAEAWVQTGSSGTAMLALADGSKVRVRPETQLQVGKLTLGSDMQRVVELRIHHGGVDTEVKPAAAGSSFQVKTPYGTAGVRGTTFRVTSTDDARVETLDGVVALEGSAGTVEVAAGKGSRVGADGMPIEPVDLPPAPEVTSPLQGPLPQAGLRWAGTPGAQGWVVEVARDAEFVLDVTSATVTKKRYLPAVRPGHWYWRVAVMDAQGFVGHWSTVHGFDVE